MPEYCLLWVEHWSMCMTKSEWAAWVQALGSVAAIVAGVLVIRYQHLLQRTAEYNRLRQDGIYARADLLAALSDFSLQLSASVGVRAEIDGIPMAAVTRDYERLQDQLKVGEQFRTKMRTPKLRRLSTDAFEAVQRLHARLETGAQTDVQVDRASVLDAIGQISIELADLQNEMELLTKAQKANRQ